MISKQEIYVVFSRWRHVAPAIPFVYKVFALLIITFYTISVTFASCLVKHNHSFPLIIILTLFMLGSACFVVNGYTYLCIFVIAFILTNAAIEIFPTLVTPSCNMPIVNFHRNVIVSRS